MPHDRTAEEDTTMADLEARMRDLKAEIENADPDARAGYEPALARLIQDMTEAELSVPPDVRDLYDELVNENIEAQFDNMPV